MDCIVCNEPVDTSKDEHATVWINNEKGEFSGQIAFAHLDCSKKLEEIKTDDQ